MITNIFAKQLTHSAPLAAREATGVFREATECGFGPTKGSESPLATEVRGVSLIFLLAVLLLCSCNKNKTPSSQRPELTAEMAFEAVNNYCHQAYDWSPAADNPSLMSVTMGEETDSTYLVVFRSYTGALVHFHVSKASGTARMVESVPALNVESEAGTLNIYDYLVQEK